MFAKTTTRGAPTYRTRRAPPGRTDPAARCNMPSRASGRSPGVTAEPAYQRADEPSNHSSATHLSRWRLTFAGLSFIQQAGPCPPRSARQWIENRAICGDEVLVDRIPGRNTVRRPGSFVIPSRDREEERGFSAELGLHRDGAAVPLDDPLADREPDPRSGALVFRAQLLEGLEHTLVRLERDADAVILDDEENPREAASMNSRKCASLRRICPPTSCDAFPMRRSVPLDTHSGRPSPGPCLERIS